MGRLKLLQFVVENLFFERDNFETANVRNEYATITMSSTAAKIQSFVLGHNTTRI